MLQLARCAPRHSRSGLNAVLEHEHLEPIVSQASGFKAKCRKPATYRQTVSSTGLRNTTSFPQ